jgi:hypothetical protein
MNLRSVAALLSLAAAAGCAAAPVARGPAAEGIVTAALGSTAQIGDLRITPLRLVEDSRCPADAMCVHQGKARVLARVARGATSAEVEMTLGGRPTWFGSRIDLVAVCPYPLASQPAAPADRRFVFSVSATDRTPPEGPDYCG